jgi:hypothetical protein
LNLKRLSLISTLILSAGTLNAETSVNERQKAIYKHTIRVFGEIHKQYGKALRVEAMLTGCKLDALAATIRPTADELLTTTYAYLIVNEDARPYADEIAGSTLSAARIYVIGFKESLT